MPTKGDRRWGSFLVQITLKFWNIISMHRSNKMASTPSKGYVVGGSEVASVWCPWCDQTKHTVLLWILSAHNIKHTTAPAGPQSGPQSQPLLFPTDYTWIACTNCHQYCSWCLLVIQWVTDILSQERILCIFYECMKKGYFSGCYEIIKYLIYFTKIKKY